MAKPANTRRASIAVLCLIVVYCASLLLSCNTMIYPGIDGDRYSFMESLVERGTFDVGQSSIRSVDWISVNGTFYSGKPPVMNFAGALVYAGLYKAGYSFARTPTTVVAVLMLVFVVVPLGLLLWAFWRYTLRWHDASWKQRPAATAGIATALLAFASLFPCYGLIFTNHVLAAALLFAAFALAQPRDSNSHWRLFATGFLAGLSVTVDLLPGTFFIAGFALASFTMLPWKRQCWFAAGAAIPMALHFGLNRLTLGVWMPSYLIKNAFNYQGSIFVGPPDPDLPGYPTYWGGLFHFVVGHRSVFLFLPLLLFGALQALRVALSRNPARSPAAWGALTAFLATLTLVPRFSMGLAGTTYGPRHMLPVIALLYAYLPMEFCVLRSRFRRILFWAAAAWSVVIGTIGTLDPWTEYALSPCAPLDVIARVACYRGSSWLPQLIVRATAVSPGHGFSRIGDHLGLQKDPAPALAAYQSALKIDPDRVEALRGVGATALKAGNAALARENLERAVTLKPDDQRAWSLLSKARLDTNDTSGSAEAAARSEVLRNQEETTPTRVQFGRRRQPRSRATISNGSGRL